MVKSRRHQGAKWANKLLFTRQNKLDLKKVDISDRQPSDKSNNTDVKARKLSINSANWEDDFAHQWGERFLTTLLLMGQVVVRLLKGKIDSRNIMEHMANVGLGSLNSVLIIAYFAGMIFTIQSARELIRYGALSAVGGAFALAFCRELAPVLTASVVAGQVGAAFAAEIGEMQVTEQIDALYMLRTNPIDYLVVPRAIACCLMLPILSVFSLFAGIGGGVFVAFYFYHLPVDVFLDSVRDFLELKDLFGVVIKAFVFGGMIAMIGCGWGLTTKGGAKGVSASTKAAVVTSWVCIFILDFVLSLAIFNELSIN